MVENSGYLNRIPASSMKRMTPQKTPQRLAGAPKNSVSLYRFGGVLRTRWGEAAAGTQPGRNCKLVAPQERQCKTSGHTETPRSVSSSGLNSAKSRSHAERRGLTTISTPRGIYGHAARRISRMRLRIRFLWTARPSFRGVVIPSLLYSRPLARTKTTKERESFLAPPL